MERLTYWDEEEQRYKTYATKQELMDKLAKYEEKDIENSEEKKINEHLLLIETLKLINEDYGWAKCKFIGCDCSECKAECLASYYLEVARKNLSK